MTREQLVEKCKRLVKQAIGVAAESPADGLAAASAAIEELAASLPDEQEFERLRATLLDCARQAEALKQDCGMDPESAQALRNARYQNISTTAHNALGAIRGPAPEAPAAPKDHEIRELVNKLTEVARDYHATEQLRERIAGLVVPFARGVATNKGDAVKATVSPPPSLLGGFDLLIDGEAGKTLLGHLAPDLSPSEYGPACPVVLSYCNGHSGPGLYASDPAYPDEGSVLIITAPVYTQEELDAAKARSIETAAAIEAACADDGDPLPPTSPPAVQPETGISQERAELVAAWNDLPDALRCHPRLKRLYRAVHAIPSAVSPDVQELLTIIEMLCNGIEWNIENHHEEMTQADEEALAQGRAALSKYGSKQ
jgi:hypothetical protein